MSVHKNVQKHTLFLLSLCFLFFAGCSSAHKSFKFNDIKSARICTSVNDKDFYCECTKDRFSATEDKIIYACLKLYMVDTQFDVLFEWFDPNNEKYSAPATKQVSDVSDRRQHILVFQKMDISKAVDLGKLGTWRLNVLLNGQIVNTQSFYIDK